MGMFALFCWYIVLIFLANFLIIQFKLQLCVRNSESRCHKTNYSYEIQVQFYKFHVPMHGNDESQWSKFASFSCQNLLTPVLSCQNFAHMIPYIANCSRWKGFAVFIDLSVIAKLLME